MSDTKVCTLCEIEKSVEDFYKHKNGTQTRCKACYKALQNYKYQKRPTGFESLSEQVQEDIIRKLRDRSIKLKTIAMEANISASTLARWMKEKQIKNQ